VANGAPAGRIRDVTTEDVLALAAELGLDAVGVARAEAYEETERHILERRERGLFGGMKFTTARPEVSCHPESLLAGVRTVVSAALCYWEPEPELPAGHGRLARYTWDDRYAALRAKLDALGRAVGGDHRVLVDANQHVDREAAARSGVGFYGKNTMLITRRHGSWVVLGTLVTTAELAPTEPLPAGCGDCTLCIDACPTGALDEPGVLDATKCLSWSTQAPEPIPPDHRAALGARVYGCDICQDVCPWNRGVEKRRGALAERADAHVDLVDWLERDGRALVEDYDRLYVPRNDPRWLRRNALVALGNVGSCKHEPVLRRYADGDDELLREHAEWALAEVERRCG
jgi:epoxyqueuosine reductase